MPVIWTYILRVYFRIFFLSLSSFIALLLLTRFKEIARFAALSSHFFTTIAFALYQIPHILPIAIPLSSLIASTILFQGLSASFELTALRSSGFSLKIILTPLLIASLLFFALTFYISSEITTYSKQKTREMLFDETTVNPLTLLKRHKLLKLPNTYIEMTPLGENRAKNPIMVTYNRASSRLSLLTAKEFSIEGDTFLGTQVALISCLRGESERMPDTLILENQKIVTTHAPSLTLFLKKSQKRLNPSSLPFALLLVRKEVKGKEVHMELLRRISLGLSAFTLTFLGASWGMEVARTKSKKGLIHLSLLSLFLFTSYMVGKQLKNQECLATFSFLLPHAILLWSAIHHLQKISKGIG